MTEPTPRAEDLPMAGETHETIINRQSAIIRGLEEDVRALQRDRGELSRKIDEARREGIEAQNRLIAVAKAMSHYAHGGEGDGT